MRRPGKRLTTFESAIDASIRRRGLLDGVSRLVLAVSGGPDSMALFYSIVRILAASESEVELVVAHLDHGLRAEAADDARHVERAASNAGVEAVLERIDLTEMAAQRRENLEAAGRAARYAFLARVASDRGAAAAATGHTATDQAETVLMRLARGSGVDGLAGIAASRELAPGIRLIRPLLDVTREDVVAYCADRGIAYREDATNADLERSRAFARHELLPRLERVSPGASSNLARTARLADDDRVYFEDLVAGLLAEWGVPAEGVVVLPAEAVAALPRALRGRVLRESVRRARGGLSRIEQSHIEAIDGLLGDGRHGREVVLPLGVRAVRRRGALVVESDVEMR